jgi:hypothetical protein
VKRFQEVTAEISGRDFRKSPQRKVEEISGGYHRDKWKRFQEVTTAISRRDFRRSPQI